MKRCLLFFGLIVLVFRTSAQDEGTIVKKERIDRSKGVFVGLGPSFTLGKNIGDYSTGFNVEVGFSKRLNRVVSIGPSVSYLNFKYDPKETGSGNVFIGGPYDDGEGGNYWLGGLIDFKGGDLSLISAGCNFKFNFVPIKDASKISVYAFAKPFVSFVSRTAVKGTAYIYENDYDPNSAEDWYDTGIYFPWEPDNDYGIEISDKLKSDTEITGGIFVGPGIEFAPVNKVSVYVQAAFGYTFPITFVSTDAYKDEDFDSLSDEFPMTKEGFPSVNLQFGVSFNF